MYDLGMRNKIEKNHQFFVCKTRYFSDIFYKTTQVLYVYKMYLLWFQLFYVDHMRKLCSTLTCWEWVSSTQLLSTLHHRTWLCIQEEFLCHSIGFSWFNVIWTMNSKAVAVIVKYIVPASLKQFLLSLTLY